MNVIRGNITALLIILSYSFCRAQMAYLTPTEWVIEHEREILHHLGWTEYFNRLQGYDTNVTLELFQNLQGENSMVWGIQISITPKILVEFIGLPNMGIQWKGRYTTLKEAVETFTDLGE